MRILIQKTGEKNRCIIIPNMLLMNRMTAALASKKLRETLSEQSIEGSIENGLTSRQLREFFKEIRRVKKIHSGKDWHLVEVQDSDGDTVKIKL